MVASTEKIIILRNTDKNDWSYSNEVILLPTKCTIESFVLSDIDYDGDKDALVGLRNMTTSGSTLLRICKNSGNGIFDEDEPIDIDLKGIGTRAIAVADVNHDLRPDIIIGSVSFDFNTPSRELIDD